MPSSRALCGSVCRAQTLTGLIGSGAPTSQDLPLSIRVNPHRETGFPKACRKLEKFAIGAAGETDRQRA